MEIYIIEYKNERAAISSKHGCIELECVRKLERGKRFYSDGQIFKFIDEIGETKDALGGPTHGYVFKNNMCEFYWFKKAPTKEQVEKVCGKLTRINKEVKFGREDKDEHIVYYVCIE